jgi:hypothetical protein
MREDRSVEPSQVAAKNGVNPKKSRLRQYIVRGWRGANQIVA